MIRRRRVREQSSVPIKLVDENGSESLLSMFSTGRLDLECDVKGKTVGCQRITEQCLYDECAPASEQQE